jgi:hypothetical protein
VFEPALAKLRSARSLTFALGEAPGTLAVDSARIRSPASFDCRDERDVTFRQGLDAVFQAALDNHSSKLRGLARGRPYYQVARACRAPESVRRQPAFSRLSSTIDALTRL